MDSPIAHVMFEMPFYMGRSRRRCTSLLVQSLMHAKSLIMEKPLYGLKIFAARFIRIITKIRSEDAIFILNKDPMAVI
jgi:hypothetical protein